MTDILDAISGVQREVGVGRVPAGEGRSIRLRRTYRAPIDDVWDALTNPERIGRWFLPVTGDYRLGGHFQFEGNAGGEIVACERPNRLRVTWTMPGMGPVGGSELELRLTAAGDAATVFELEHTAVVPDEMWNDFGPGAVGVGWDGGLLGLGLHLDGRGPADPAWPMSDEGRAFYAATSEAWGEANRAAGADPDAAARGVANTTAFYAPPPEAT